MKPPRVIFLQWHGDSDERTEYEPLNLASAEVTWCADKIYDRDIRYIRDKRYRVRESKPKAKKAKP